MLTPLGHFLTCVDSCWLVLHSCWIVLDSCWFVLSRVGLVLTRVRLVLIRADSCRTRVDSCWFVSDLCCSCWFVLTRVDLCWYSCIRIDLILANISNLFLIEFIFICGALRDLVPFVQFKKREEQPWKSANFSKVAGFTPATLLKLTILHECFHVF